MLSDVILSFFRAWGSVQDYDQFTMESDIGHIQSKNVKATHVFMLASIVPEAQINDYLGYLRDQMSAQGWEKLAEYLSFSLVKEKRASRVWSVRSFAAQNKDRGWATIKCGTVIEQKEVSLSLYLGMAAHSHSLKHLMPNNMKAKIYKG